MIYILIEVLKCSNILSNLEISYILLQIFQIARFLLQKLFIFFDWTCRRRGVDVVDKTNDNSDERLSDFEPEIARDAGME